MDKGDGRTITKKELSERIADRTGEKRTAVRRVLQSFLDEIVAELSAGNRIEFREFGVFEVKTRAPRTAQNPRTLERVRVPERKSVKFKPGRKMRDLIEAVETTPLPEPKAGVRPDTRGIGQRIEHAAQRDGQALRQA
ncbi:MAG: HU family DNA-binding protein [Phycisphaerales bacterium]